MSKMHILVLILMLKFNHIVIFTSIFWMVLIADKNKNVDLCSITTAAFFFIS